MIKARPRVVFDTNVIISSLWGGYPRKVIDIWQGDRIAAITTLEILAEYMNVSKRFNLDPEVEEEFLLLFSDPQKTFFVKPASSVNIIGDDPADNKFLSGAVAGNAGYIISGDKHLLVLGQYKKIKILTPKDFVLMNSK